MKKLYSLMLAGLVLAAPNAAMAMDSASLLANPAKYRVIAAGEDEVVYADLSTLTAIQTMDFPNSVENMHFKMCVESYRDKVNAMDFARDNLVTSIREFDAGLYVNKNTKSYNLETRLCAVYKADGEALKALDPKEAKEAEKLRVKAQDLYMNLSRMSRMPQKYAHDTAERQAAQPETQPAETAQPAEAAVPAPAPEGAPTQQTASAVLAAAAAPAAQ